jgi:hypothetical protein
MSEYVSSYTFPIKLKAFHSIKCMPKEANNGLAQVFIRSMVKMCGQLIQGFQMYFHYSQNKEEIVQSLEFHGISKTGFAPLHWWVMELRAVFQVAG